MTNRNKAFTLIELLVVVAIIGILAAVGVVAYNGYTASAKASTTKANFKLVTNYVRSEVIKCEMGSSFIMDKLVDCSDRAGANFIYQDAINMKNRTVSFFQKKIKNPYTNGNGIVNNSGIPDNDKEIGEIHIGSMSGSPEYLNFSVCFKSPCSNADNRIFETVYLPE